MSKVIFFSLFWASAVSLAFPFGSKNGYELKLALTVNGKPVSTPTLVVKAGEKSSVTQKADAETETFIDVVAHDGGGHIKGKEAISMSFVLGTIKNGQRTVLASPRIITLENSKAEVRIEGSEENQNVNLSVVAERVSL